MNKKKLVVGLIFFGVLVGLGIVYRPRANRLFNETGNDSLGGGLLTETDPITNQSTLTENLNNQELTTQTEVNNEEKQISFSSPPPLAINENRDYLATLTTSAGTIIIDLLEQNTPITVNNFVFLANQGFYNEIIFHRIVRGFMIQGGCPNGDGSGGPGYRFDDEPFEGQYSRGTVAMANAGPDTNGSQFFILHQDYDLPPDYVIFGRVVEGIETVDRIATAPVRSSRMGENSSPVDPIVITSVEITTR